MSYCAVKSCKNNKKKVNKSNGDVTYHKFPKDSTFKGEWIAATGQDDNWFPPPGAVICSKHFDQNCFIENNDRRFLKNGSTPTLKLSPCSKCSASIECSDVSQDMRELEEHDLKIVNIHTCINAASVNSSLNIGAAEVTEDKVMTARLLKLEREKNYYKKLAETRRKKIRAKNVQNFRLKKKINSMQSLLDTLQAKFYAMQPLLDTLQAKFNLEGQDLCD